MRFPNCKPVGSGNRVNDFYSRLSRGIDAALQVVTKSHTWKRGTNYFEALQANKEPKPGAPLWSMNKAAIVGEEIRCHFG